MYIDGMLMLKADKVWGNKVVMTMAMMVMMVTLTTLVDGNHGY